MNHAQMTSLPRPSLNRPSFLGEVINTLLFIIAVFTLMQLALPRSVVHGSSMEPNFEEGQYLIISRLNYLIGEPHRGDIVVFNSPEADSGDPSLIKRVIGLPGDFVEIIETQVYINGELLDEPYIKEACNVRRCRDNTWELGPDQYFLMGDNRNVSQDSRSFGPVTRDHIIGEALFRYWPPESIGIVQGSHYPAE
ncbi:MAG: signal peptidase I [Chloroflexota bacterium]